MELLFLIYYYIFVPNIKKIPKAFKMGKSKSLAWSVCLNTHAQDSNVTVRNTHGE